MLKPMGKNIFTIKCSKILFILSYNEARIFLLIDLRTSYSNFPESRKVLNFYPQTLNICFVEKNNMIYF